MPAQEEAVVVCVHRLLRKEPDGTTVYAVEVSGVGSDDAGGGLHVVSINPVEGELRVPPGQSVGLRTEIDNDAAVPWCKIGFSGSDAAGEPVLTDWITLRVTPPAAAQ